MRKITLWTLLAVLFSTLPGCRTIQYVPVKEVEYVSVHDTTILHSTDTLIKVPEVSLKDFVNLEDTLRMTTGIVTAKAWIDEPSASIIGTLVQTGKVPVTVIEKERLVYKDSITTKDIPVPYEVKVPYTPWYSKALSFVGVLALVALGLWLFLRFKR